MVVDQLLNRSFAHGVRPADEAQWSEWNRAVVSEQDGCSVLARHSYPFRQG